MHPFKHFKVITKHRHMVIYHCFKCGIPIRGLLHDLSKYTPTEFFRGAKYFLGTKSPNEAERNEKGYSFAWMHHQGRNKHHFEFWRDYNPATRSIEPVKMPYVYLIEMFCDRVAASKNYQGKNYTQNHPLDYFNNSPTTRYIHPETAYELEFLLKMLIERGEKETFSFIKNRIKNKYTY